MSANTDDAALVKTCDRMLAGNYDTQPYSMRHYSQEIARALKARLAGDAVAARVDYYMQVGGDKYHVFPDMPAPSPTTPALTLGDYKDPARAEAAEQAVVKIVEIEKRHAEAERANGDYWDPDDRGTAAYGLDAHADRATLLAYIRTQQTDTAHHTASGSTPDNASGRSGIGVGELSLPPVEPAGDDVELFDICALSAMIEVEIEKHPRTGDNVPKRKAVHDLIRAYVEKKTDVLRARSAATPGQPALSPECQAKVARIRSDYLNDRALTVQQASDMGWLLQTLTTLTEQRATPGEGIVEK